jgi:hypothetical protein
MAPSLCQTLKKDIQRVGFLNKHHTPFVISALLIACLFAHGVQAAKLYCDPKIKSNAATARIAGIANDIGAFDKRYDAQAKPDNIDDMFCGNAISNALDAIGKNLSSDFTNVDQDAASKYVQQCKDALKQFTKNLTQSQTQAQQQGKTPQDECQTTTLSGLFANSIIKTIYDYLIKQGNACPDINQIAVAAQKCADNLTATCIVNAINTYNANLNSNSNTSAPISTVVSPTPTLDGTTLGLDPNTSGTGKDDGKDGSGTDNKCGSGFPYCYGDSI